VISRIAAADALPRPPCRNILPDTEYYITRQIIPPINRVLKLVGVDAAAWYAQMPRRHLVYDRFRVKDGKGKMGKTLDATWRTAHCLVCGVRCGKDQGETCGDDTCKLAVIRES
jgi:DNA polymerase zeta